MVNDRQGRQHAVWVFTGYFAGCARHPGACAQLGRSRRPDWAGGRWRKVIEQPSLALVFEGYTTLIRGVPDLVLMLLIFYGLQIALNSVTDALGMAQFDIDPMIAGIITLGFIYGAYFTETFRGAYLAVPKGHIEAATAFGFSGGQTFRRILFPAMMRYALPG